MISLSISCLFSYITRTKGIEGKLKTDYKRVTKSNIMATKGTGGKDKTFGPQLQLLHILKLKKDDRFVITEKSCSYSRSLVFSFLIQLEWKEK